MGFCMAHPWRDKSGVWYLRERVPHALKKTVKGRAVALPVAEGTHTIKLGDMALLSLRTKEKGEALRRWTAAREALLRFYDGCRLGEITLDFKQAMALAREHFDELAEIAEGEARDILAEFQGIIRRKALPELDAWLDRAGCSLIATFANGIIKDRKAVQAAIVSTWSNGQTEGQICKLKLVKRQMYGRGKIDLLQARVIGMN